MKHFLLSVLFVVVCNFSFSQTQPYCVNVTQSPIHVGNDSIRLIHLTDIHIDLKDNNAKNNFTIACEYIADHYSPNSTFVMITGDLSEANKSREKKDEFLIAKEILDNTLSKKGIKYFVAPGNHDYGKGGYRALAESRQYFNEIFSLSTFPDCFALDKLKLCFIGLNTMGGLKNIDGRDIRVMTQGEVGEKQRQLLIDKLEKYKGYRVILYQHHAIFNADNGRKWMTLKDKEEMSRIIKEYDVKYVLNGHRHLDPPLIFRLQDASTTVVESASLTNFNSRNIKLCVIPIVPNVE